MTPFDIGIRCDYFLPMTKASWDRDVFIGITGSKIAAISPWANQKAKTFINAKDKIVLPGLINGHTHLGMSLFRGLSDDLEFNQWLYKTIFPIEAKLLSAEFVRTGVELSALEALRFGVTTVCDMYYFEDVAAEVIDKAGMRAVLAEAVLDFPVPDNKEGKDENYKILDKMCEVYKNHERVTPCVGPHAPYTVSDTTFKKAAQYARSKNLKLNIHIAETKKEVDDSLKQFHKTPVERLEGLGVLEVPCIFAHCVHVTHKDIETMVKHHVSAIYNPESNMKLGSGVAPIPQMLKMGLKVGMGTDGPASNNDQSLFREMDSGAKLQKLSHSDNTAMTAFQALELTTKKGAEALGLGDRIGTLEVGKCADIILVDTQYGHMQPLYDPFSQLVYSASGLEVETVICHGKILVDKGECLTLDKEKIFKDVRQMRDLVQSQLT